jgi:hypothetical protein
MPEHDRKSKMISLRLSEDEYEAMQKSCRSYGARNVSDLARLALHCVFDNTPATDGTLLTRVDELGQRLSMLERLVAQLQGARVGVNGDA